MAEIVNASQYFEKQCMERLDNFVNSIHLDKDNEEPFMEANLPLSSDADPDKEDEENANLEALSKLKKPYADLIKKYPNILKNTFKSEPIHKVYHKIETLDEVPVTSKVRPLLADSDKSKLGEKVWNEMLQMGIIERVDPS